jgi:hypothetical protein
MLIAGSVDVVVEVVRFVTLLANAEVDNAVLCAVLVLDGGFGTFSYIQISVEVNKRI